MSVKRAVGLVLLSIGTSTLALILLLMEVFRSIYHEEVYTWYTMTYLPVPLCFAIAIGWTIAGIVLVVRGKGQKEQ